MRNNGFNKGLARGRFRMTATTVAVHQQIRLRDMQSFFDITRFLRGYDDDAEKNVY